MNSLRVKMLILGDSGTGKSALISRICKDRYDPVIKPTVGLNFQTTFFRVKFHDENVDVNITVWDLGGKETYENLVETFAKNFDCAIYCFDMKNKTSFQNVIKWMGMIDEHRIHQPQYLIGTKFDLTTKKAAEDEVDIEDIDDFVKDYQLDGFLLTSAKAGTNIRKLMETVVGDFVKKVKNETD